MKKRLVLLAAGLFVVNLGTAHALVLLSGAPAQILRKDVGKQLSKYALCLIKALQGCEATGASSGPECIISDPNSVPPGLPTATPPADGKIKFVAAVALCETKVLLSKKSPTRSDVLPNGDPVADYESIGCPGDSDPDAGGDQLYTDLNAYQAGSVASVKAVVAAQSVLIDTFGCAAGGNHTADAPPTGTWTLEADLACVADEGKKLGKLVKGIFKCGAKCENDYKDIFGNGGTTDDGAVCGDDVGSDPLAKACIDLVYDKVTKFGLAPFDTGETPFPEEPADWGVQWFIDNLLAPGLSEAGDDIYNENDCAP
jgi:hypothetical protein